MRTRILALSVARLVLVASALVGPALVGSAIAGETASRPQRPSVGLPQVFVGHFGEFGSRQRVVLVLDDPIAAPGGKLISAGWEIYLAVGRNYTVPIEVEFDPASHAISLKENVGASRDLWSPDPLEGSVSGDLNVMMGAQGEFRDFSFAQ